MVIAEINRISRTYGEVKAVQDVSFSVGEKEIFGIIGPDGSGKTSLLRILVTLLLPDSGSASIKGFDIVKDFRKIRNLVGYMPGRFSLYQDLSVEENLGFYARVFGSSIEKNYDLIKDIYHQIEPFKKRKAGDLSGGMKQKLALSCALIHRPSLLVLDEPTTGVDAVSRKEFWDLLAKIKDEGIPVIVSTPYMDEASRCDRVALMQKGKILRTDKPEEINKSYKRRLYSVRAKNSGYNLLRELRKLSWCHSAWLFGQDIHLSLKDNISDADFESQLKNMKEAADFRRIDAGIEDSFIELMNKQQDE